MLLVGLSHSDACKRNFIPWFGTAGTAVKDDPVILVDNSVERIKRINKVFSNPKLFSIATMLDTLTGVFVAPL